MDLDLPYLPLQVAVNCSVPASESSDPARANYACSPTRRLESTIIHLLFITAMAMLTAIVFLVYRVIQNRKAKKAVLQCAVAATAAAGSKERALSALESACAPAMNMLRAAAQASEDMARKRA